MCGTSDIGGRIYLYQPSPGNHNSAMWKSRLLAHHDHRVTCMVVTDVPAVMWADNQRAPT